MEPLPSIHKIFSLIMQQERKNNNSRALSVENKVFLNIVEKS